LDQALFKSWNGTPSPTQGTWLSLTTLTVPQNNKRCTRTSLWYVPAPVANAYWAQVQGATWKGARAGWTFPCNTQLPDITLVISGKNITVPGINMNYQTISANVCYGGMQRTDSSARRELHIAGDVFLKNLFVAFEHPDGGQARLGFARQA
jgi:aspergillopepsin I